MERRTQMQSLLPHPQAMERNTRERRKMTKLTITTTKTTTTITRNRK
jgi:hypothetical protein